MNRFKVRRKIEVSRKCAFDSRRKGDIGGLLGPFFSNRKFVGDTVQALFFWGGWV
jgi:hypothetical protein